jgi:hypothetical protein
MSSPTFLYQYILALVFISRYRSCFEGHCKSKSVLGMVPGSLRQISHLTLLISEVPTIQTDLSAKIAAKTALSLCV